VCKNEASFDNNYVYDCFYNADCFNAHCITLQDKHAAAVKKEPKELTPEQKAREDAKKEKRRLAKRKNYEKKMAAK
jgi:hypothetical protein